MDGQADISAAFSANFGFLAPLATLLAFDGAAAETHLYSDPDAAMVMARRFTETLAKALIRLTQMHVIVEDESRS